MSNVTVVDIGGIIQAHRRGFTFLGAALVVAGLLAIFFPLAGTFLAETWVAISFLMAGGAQIASSFSTRQWQGTLIGLIIGLIYVATGAILWLRPAQGIETLTILVAAVFLVEGVMQAVLAFQIRPVDGWIWLLLSGLLGIIVAIMIWRHLPSASVWVLGLLLGANLIASGLAFIMLASSARPMTGMPGQKV